MSVTDSSVFPKMGAEPLTDHLVDISGNRSPYTIRVPRHGPSADSEPGDQALRGVGSDATGEHSGPRFAPVTTVFYPNAPEWSETGRALRTVPSKVGALDFWDARSEDNGGTVI